ncbi:FAD-dependent oxidoreductase [Candidatus Hepatincolaceae symbiont of Richtersius coronifer]
MDQNFSSNNFPFIANPKKINPPKEVTLGFGLEIKDLYCRKKLKNLDNMFLKFLKAKDKFLYHYVITNRKNNKFFGEDYGNESEELVKCARLFEEFLFLIFPAAQDNTLLNKSASLNNKLLLFKKLFIKGLVKQNSLENAQNLDFNKIRSQFYDLLQIQYFNEERIIDAILAYLQDKDQYKQELELACNFASCIMFVEEIAALFEPQIIFFKAKKRNFDALIAVKYMDLHKIEKAEYTVYKIRKNFNYYDNTSPFYNFNHSNYCVKCHIRSRDYCRKGELEKPFITNESSACDLTSVSQKNYKVNPLQAKLSGCPLGMHISQMHILNETNNLLAALVIITINNPLAAATGEHICNDCSVSCIFQKQEAVDTPKVETTILKKILSLPWGFEIYSLLTRWNPLRFYRPYPKATTNYNVLVVGLGPSGYSLAYNLLNEGHNVIAIDALKIEPLPANLYQDFKPIIDFHNISEDLEDRIIYGFGGVSEYGITSRWDKNFLKVIRIILQRQNNLQIIGNIRFGSSLDINTVKKIGFHHIALCAGVGESKILNIPNMLSKGIRTSSEFLMTLNLGAFKKDNLFNLQIRLPLIVLGGGLTAIDCANEAIIYYQRQLEKIIGWYNDLLEVYQVHEITAALNAEDNIILQEYLAHYNLLKKAQSAPEKDSVITAINQMGGVKIIYHKALQESKAYKTNTHELGDALKQGVTFLENLNLENIQLDEFGSLNRLIFSSTKKLNEININDKVEISAKTLILALGVQSNSSFAKDFHPKFSDNQIIGNANSKFIADFDPIAAKVQDNVYKDQNFSILYDDKSTYISCFGDMQKTFQGSVVKALASTAYGQYFVNDILKQIPKKSSSSFAHLLKKFNKLTKISLNKIKTINHNTYEIQLQGGLLNQSFAPTQFFKIQNLSISSTSIENIAQNSLQLEPIMLTGLNSTKKNTIKCAFVINGSSTKILKHLIKANQNNITITGPLGNGYLLDNINVSTNIVCISEGRGIIGVLSLLLALRPLNNSIKLFAFFNSEIEIIYLKELMKTSALLFVTVKNIAPKKLVKLKLKYEGKIHFYQGDKLDLLKLFYQKSTSNGQEDFHLPDHAYFLQNIKLYGDKDYIFVSGGCDFTKQVRDLNLQYKDILHNSIQILSTNSPMQCGNQGACGTCLQKHVDSKGKTNFTYTCSYQNQNLHTINLENLKARLNQNSLQEKLSSLWFTQKIKPVS